MKKLTNEEFLDEIWSINPSYKERFCYELCVYTGRSNKIKITCKKHNCLFEVCAKDFMKRAEKEIKEKKELPNGCFKCGTKGNLSNEEFLDKIWSINPSYKERFCYELCLYTGMKKKIKITCKKHNCLFEVLASNHFSNAKKEIKKNILFSGGCNKCISCIRKANIYKNNDTHLPENYNEIDWKIIEDFEDYYINNKGDIWSTLSNKLIKSHVNEQGYLIVALYKKSTKKNKNKRVHILVAESFVNNPNPELYNIVNHKDGIRANPLYTNLDWTNKSGNSKHANEKGNANRDNQRNEITILNENNDVLHKFYSQKDACSFLEVSNYCIQSYFKETKTILNEILIKNKWKLEKKTHKPIAVLNKYDTDNENWIEILPDYPNYYISNFGNVKKGGKITHLSNEEGFILPSSNGEGDHLSVTLRNGENFKRIHVHWLVIQYHLKVKYDTSDMIIDHIDNNKQNNYIGNLEWVNCHINTQRAMIEGCWNRKDRKQNVSHIRYIKWGCPNKKTNIQKFKYHVCMNISGIKNNRFADTKEEAIQKKKELYAIMIITNYIKYKKGIYPKYYKLNINFNNIDNEIKLL